MWPDQWLVDKFARLLYWRYGRTLGAQLTRWDSLREQERLRRLVRALAAAGEDITIRQGVQIIAPEQVRLGSHIGIGYYSLLRGNGGITLEDFVLLGDYVVIATGSHPIGGLYFHTTWTQPVTLRQNVWVGANALILPGVTIGENAVIGAGAVVTEDIPANSIAVGSPARVVRQIEVDPAALEAQKQAMREQRLRKIAVDDTPDVF